MSARNSARSTTKMHAEKRMVRQREKEHEREMKWGSQVRYYKNFEKTNNKFSEWTSPRYYETNNRMIQTQKNDRVRKETLEKRREKLRKLLAEETQSHEIELIVRNRHKYPKSSVPLEVLRDVRTEVKCAEEERKRHEAELALYQQWRNNAPALREHRVARATKDMKLSWLDQQIEKKLEKERKEEECRRMLAERAKRLEEESAKEEAIKREMAEKNERLRCDVEKQIEELSLAQKRSEELRSKEDENSKELAVLAELEERNYENARRKKQRELALENLERHKMKLKQKADDVRENLEREKELMRKLLESEVSEKMEDQTKKEEVKQTIREFLKFARDQQELEKQRQKHFNFVFDSEAKSIFERQQEVWAEEERARNALVRDVLGTVKEQIEEHISRNKEEQRLMLEERKGALEMLEKYDQDMQEIKREEERKKKSWKDAIEQQIREKEEKTKMERMLEKKEVDLELEAARREEERLRREIVELQRKQGPIRHTRSRILF